MLFRSAKLGLAKNAYSITFQLRLGRDRWIEPYTEQRIRELAEAGVKNLAVVCPAFVADCLETLEEIGIRLRDEWLSLGGSSLHLVPCVNDHTLWVDGFAEHLKSYSNRQGSAA